LSKGRFLVLLVAIGSAIFFWRRKNRSPERVDLYYADGSMITLAPEAPDTVEIFSLAREIAGNASPS
jgi:hypothetical protein